MNKILFALFLLCVTLVVHAQEELNVEKTKKRDKTLQVNRPNLLPLVPTLPDLQQPIFAPNKLSIIFPRYIPIYTPNTSNAELDSDFQEAQLFSLSNNLSIHTSKREETYFGFGEIYMAKVALEWKLGKKLRVAGGAFLNKQFTPLNLSPIISYGASSLIQYYITEKVQLNIYGNYLNKNPIDPFTTTNSLFTQTKIGSNVTFIKDESRKIGIGVDHQFNVSTKQWAPVYGTKITYKFPGR